MNNYADKMKAFRLNRLQVLKRQDTEEFKIALDEYEKE